MQLADEDNKQQQKSWSQLSASSKYDLWCADASESRNKIAETFENVEK